MKLTTLLASGRCTHIVTAGLLLAVQATAMAGPLSEARSMVNTYCGRYDAPVQQRTGASGLSLSCDDSGSGTTYISGEPVRFWWQGASSANTALGNVGGALGLVDVVGSASATGPRASSVAGAGGTADIYFRINALAPLPAGVSELPIRFAAKGEAYLSGDSQLLSGSYSALARLSGPENWESFQIERRDLTTPSRASFDSSKTVSLVLKPDAVFALFVSAGCSANAHGGYEGVPLFGGHVTTGWAECGAVVDPWLSFDQEVFDARMGFNTFRLADYFKFEFSPNVPAAVATVPEASSLALLVLTLVLLSFWRSRRPGGNPSLPAVWRRGASQ